MAHWKVTKQESGIKLIPFLRTKLGPDYSLRFFKRSLESNLCTINKRLERFGTTALGTGDIVDFRYEGMEKQTSAIKQLLQVLYRDEDFVIIDKPSGVASDDPILLKQLTASSPDLINLELVHRLDKETSGILIFARSSEIFKSMVALFKDRKVKKKYLALVNGIPRTGHGIIRNYLAKLHTYQGQSIWGECAQEKGLIAITEWQAIAKHGDSALILCSPITGRTHQLRVHLSGIGHSILGDKQYGKQLNNIYQAKRCLLHALEITFPHPKQPKIIKVKSPLPKDILEALKTLGLRYE